MVTIERECNSGRNPLLTITKKELVDILKKKKVKNITKKNKKELCDIFISLQKKSKRKKIIGKKSKKKKIEFSKKLENVKEVQKYKGVAANPIENNKTEEEQIMFKYCVPEIYKKYDLWLKEDAEQLLEKINDPNTPKEWFDKMKIDTDPEQLENLKVEIDFCKEFLDNE